MNTNEQFSLPKKEKISTKEQQSYLAFKRFCEELLPEEKSKNLNYEDLLDLIDKEKWNNYFGMVESFNEQKNHNISDEELSKKIEETEKELKNLISEKAN